MDNYDYEVEYYRAYLLGFVKPTDWCVCGYRRKDHKNNKFCINGNYFRYSETFND